MSGQDDPQNHPNLDAPAEIVAELLAFETGESRGPRGS